MNKERENFKIEIQQLYKKLRDNTHFYNETLKLTDRISMMKLLDIFDNDDACRIDISEHEFYWLVKNYNKLIKDEKIIDDTFKIYAENFKEFDVDFTDKEVANAELYIVNSEGMLEENKSNILQIHNIQEVVEDTEYCSVKILASELAKIFNSVSWNPFSQREVTVKNTRMGSIKIPTIYRRNVDQIKQSMRDGNFKSNMISLNILSTDDDTESYSYNKELNTLIFEKVRGSVLDCVDGFHRLTAISELIGEDPSYGDKVHMQLKVWHMDIREASAFVNQEASGTAVKIDKKEITADDIYMDIVNGLNNDGNKKRNA